MKRLPTLACLVLFLLVAFGARADPPTARAVAERVGFSKESIARIEKGEVVAEALNASSDKDLALGVAMIVEASTAKIFDLVDGRKLSKQNSIVISGGEIDPAEPSLAAMDLPPDALKQLAGDPTGTFFVSDEEARKLSAAAGQGEARVLDAYRAVLAARAKAYWEDGLAGIVPYSGGGSGGKQRSPKLDLGVAQEIAQRLVENETFLKELEAAPSKSPGKATHQLLWSVEKGRDQAAPVLAHRILYREGDAEVFLERRFYSGYDYDALQILVGVFPAKGDRSVVLYTNHTYTAQVAGFGGGAKRSIGRKLLQKKIVAELERARNGIVGD